MEKTCQRVNVTFWFDEDIVSGSDLHDRLDALLVEHFDDLDDWHVRWVHRLEDSPLFSADHINRLFDEQSLHVSESRPPCFQGTISFELMQAGCQIS